MNQLTENIKNLRLLHGYTQRQLAQMIERAPSTLSNWEKGEISPDGESIRRLCEVFNCTPNQLFGVDKNEELEKYMLKREDALKEIQKMQQQKSELDARIRAYQRLLNN